MNLNRRDLKRILINNSVLGIKDSIDLTAVPSNDDKNKKHRYKNYFLWINKEIKYIINDTKLGPINYKAYNLIKNHLGDLVCKVIKVTNENKAIYLTEYFEGETINTALKKNLISENDYIKIAEDIYNKLKVTEAESTVLEAEKEYKRLLKHIKSIDSIEDFDKQLLHYLVEPIFNNLIKDTKPLKRITSGDFHGDNILINEDSSFKLIDLEFVNLTHFYQEDWIRFNHFSELDLNERIRKRYIGKWHVAYELIFLLKQIILEHKVSTSYLFYKHWPQKIKRIVSITKELGFISKGTIFDIINVDSDHIPKEVVDNWQIFWSVNNRFTESNSIKKDFEPGTNVRVELDLRKLQKPVQLRFDPVTSAGEIIIDKITIEGGRKHKKQKVIKQSEIIESGDIVEINRNEGRFLSTGFDPRFRLPDIGKGFEKLTILLRFNKEFKSAKEISEKLIDAYAVNEEYRNKIKNLEQQDTSKIEEYKLFKKERSLIQSKIAEISKNLTTNQIESANTDENLELIKDNITNFIEVLKNAHVRNKTHEEQNNRLREELEKQVKNIKRIEGEKREQVEINKRLEKVNSSLEVKIEKSDAVYLEIKKEKLEQSLDLKKLVKVNSSLENELGKGKSDLEVLKKEIQTRASEINRLEKLNLSLEGKLEKSNEDLLGTKKEYIKNSLELKRMDKLNSSLEVKLDKSNTDLLELKKENEAGLKSNKKLEIECSSLKVKLDKSNTDLLELKKKNEAGLKSNKRLEIESSSLKVKLDKSNTDLLEVKNKNYKQDSQLKKLEKANSKLEVTLNKNSLDFTKLETLYKEKIKSIEVINNQLYISRKTINKKQKDISERNGTITQLSKELDEFRKLIKLKNQNINFIKSKSESLSKDKHILEKVNQDLKEVISKLESKLVKLDKDNDRETNDLERLLDGERKRVTSLSSETRNLRKDIQEKNTQLSNLNTNLELSEKENKEIFVFLNKLSHQIMDMEYVKLIGNVKFLDKNTSKQQIKKELKDNINLLITENIKIYKDIKKLRKYLLNIEKKLSNKAQRLNLALQENKALTIEQSNSTDKIKFLLNHNNELQNNSSKLGDLLLAMKSKTEYLRKANKNNKAAYLKYENMYKNITGKFTYKFLRKFRIF